MRILVAVWVGLLCVFLATTGAAEEGGGGAAELAALLQDPLANISALITDNTFSFRTGS